MKLKRIISALLAVFMISGTLGSFVMLPASAADTATSEGTTTADENTPGEGESTDTEDTDTSKYTYEDYTAKALLRSYSSITEMLNSKTEAFQLMMSAYGYELYANIYTGDVVLKDTATGQYLSSNPYSLTGISSEDVKAELLSQIVVTYTDNGSESTLYSYTEAAKRGQLTVTKIKNGVRVEYKIGRQSADYLVPGYISAERFQTKIIEQMILNGLTTSDFPYGQVVNYYSLKDPNDPTLTDSELKDMYTQFPITKTGLAIYVFKGTATPKEYTKIEDIIGTYTNYSYEDLQEDHEQTGYTSNVKDPALFKVALEYTITENGLQVELPANSIRFDEDNYGLSNISILQYFGAADINNNGYVFYPDGSGALLELEDLRYQGSSTKGNGNTISGKIYGQDYAYHTVTGAHISTISLPVYGIVSSVDKKTQTGTYTTSSGFLAIITEGDSLTSIKAGSSQKHYYASSYTTFYPRPSDTYDLSNALSAGTTGSWTVESSRKYVGRYIINYVMLSDATLGELAIANGSRQTYYEATWVGMAVAYRDYLEKAGVLTRLSSLSVSDQLPLYIETFGTIPSTIKVLSIPVNVDAALTTFTDIMTMYDDFKKQGITNINFKLTGYANGGLYSTYPVKAKWMSELGGKSGYEDLIEYANSNGFGVYPDFDFMYVNNTAFADGISLKNIVAKTIDDRYSSKQIYDPAYQMFVSYYSLCVSPSALDDIYAKFLKKWNKSANIGISVSTIGSNLNSDFNVDDPQNREDAKDAVSELLAQIADTNNSVMTEGGNAYTLKYVDHLLNAALDSSRYNYASASIPFVGFILHGYINFAGSALNMAGDIDYQMLKAIENGASPYFILSYSNTELLKEYYTWSQYYSINYSIWFDDLVAKYNELNGAIGDLQTSLLVNHKFLSGVRVTDEIDDAEIEAYIEELRTTITASTIAAANAEILSIYKDLFNSGYIGSGLTKDDVNTVIPIIESIIAELKVHQANYAEIVDKINASGRAAIVDQINSIGLEIAELRLKLSEIEIARANATTEEEKEELTLQYNAVQDEINAKTADQATLTASLKNYEPEYTENLNSLTFYTEQVEKYENMLETLYADTTGIDQIIENAVNEAIEAYYEEISPRYQVTDDVVYVQYENGVAFILNYNVFSVTVEIDGTTYDVDSYGFVRINK